MEQAILTPCLIKSKLQTDYKNYLLENNHRKKDALFNKIIARLNNLTRTIILKIKISDVDMREELLQIATIKILEKITLDRIDNIIYFETYIRSIAFNAIRDYYTLTNIYKKHKRRYFIATKNGIEFIDSHHHEQSELIIKPIMK